MNFGEVYAELRIEIKRVSHKGHEAGERNGHIEVEEVEVYIGDDRLSNCALEQHILFSMSESLEAVASKTGSLFESGGHR